MTDLEHAFAWELLGLDGSPKGLLEGADRGAGTLERSIFTERRYGGTLTFTDRGQVDDWTSVMLRPWLYTDGAGYPLATVLPTIPKDRWTTYGKTPTLQFFDRTQRLARHSRPFHAGVEAGELVIHTVEYLIRVADPFWPQIAITPSGLRTSAHMGWEPGTPTLQMINDLLAAVGYGAIYTDEWGTYRAEPYVIPAQRPLTHEWLPGSGSRHMSTVEEDHNLDDVHNHVIVVGRREGENEPPIGEARNDNELDPLSIPRRGVYTRRESDHDVVDVATASAAAARLLAEEKQTTRSVEMEHVWRPSELGDKERLVTAAGLDITGVRVKDSWTLSPGSLVKATLREV